MCGAVDIKWFQYSCIGKKWNSRKLIPSQQVALAILKIVALKYFNLNLFGKNIYTNFIESILSNADIRIDYYGFCSKFKKDRSARQSNRCECGNKDVGNNPNNVNSVKSKCLIICFKFSRSAQAVKTSRIYKRVLFQQAMIP